jgi:hypothetical protein
LESKNQSQFASTRRSWPLSETSHPATKTPSRRAHTRTRSLSLFSLSLSLFASLENIIIFCARKSFQTKRHRKIRETLNLWTLFLGNPWKGKQCRLQRAKTLCQPRKDEDCEREPRDDDFVRGEGASLAWYHLSFFNRKCFVFGEHFICDGILIFELLERF